MRGACCVLLSCLLAGACVETSGPVLVTTPPPVAMFDSVAPLPTADQLAWQSQELTAFFHYGVNTFTDKEQGDGTDSPNVFNPTGLDIAQWMTALRDAGFRQAMLTAKHHDGFCLWPTNCTAYSVKSSAWMNGQGDVVKQFVDAANQAGIGVALALSPLDHHDPSFGTPAYADVFKCEVSELLTNYGAVDELWMWDFPVTGAQPMIDFKQIHTLARQLQPHTLVNVANVAGAAGGDVRSTGQAAATAAAPGDQSNVANDPAGAANPPIWYPAEAVYRTRPGWFWHAAEDARVATLTQLVGYYFDSVGRDSNLRLNLSPDKTGVVAPGDVTVMNQLGDAIRGIYRSNVAAARPATADSVFMDAAPYAASMAVDGKLNTFWAAAAGATTARLELDLGEPVAFNVVSIQEPIALGQRITAHHIEAKVNGVWTTIATGTTVGQRKLHRIAAVTATGLRVVITAARAAPAIAELGAYQSPYP